MQAVLVMFRSDGERRSFSLSREMTVIGRRQDCDLMIPLNEISRKHCRFIRDGEELRLEDLGSSNGTFCNGRRIQEAVLAPGDTVQVGPVTFVVQIDGHPGDDEIQPFSNSAGGDDIEEIEHEEAPSRGRGAAAVGAGAALGAAGRASAAADDDDALMELPDDEESDELMELPSEDDLLNDLSSNAPADADEEPLDMMEEEAPPTLHTGKPAAPVAQAEPLEDELDVLEDDLLGEEGGALPLETAGAEDDDTPLAFDDTPLPLGHEELVPVEESPAALDTKSYRAPGEMPADGAEATSPSPYDDVLGTAGEGEPLAADDELLTFDEVGEAAEPIGVAAEGSGEAPLIELAGETSAEPLGLDDSSLLAEPATEGTALSGEIPMLESESEVAGGSAESSLELGESDLLGAEVPAEGGGDALGDDFAIGHHAGGAVGGPEAETASHEAAAEDDSALLAADDAELDFSETDDLLELAEDPDGQGAAGHEPMNEDDLLDLLGDPHAKPHDPNASPTDHSANH